MPVLEQKMVVFFNSKWQCLIKQYLFRNQSASHECAVINAMSRMRLKFIGPRTSSYIDYVIKVIVQTSPVFVCPPSYDIPSWMAVSVGLRLACKGLYILC